MNSAFDKISKFFVLTVFMTATLSACGFNDAKQNDLLKASATLESTEDFCYTMSYEVQANHIGEIPEDIANCAVASGDKFVAELGEIGVGNWKRVATAKEAGFLVSESFFNVKANQDNLDVVSFVPESGDINIPDPERPLNLASLDAESSVKCMDNLAPANDTLESDIAGFQADPPTVDRVTLASDKGICEGHKGLCEAAAGRLAAEVVIAKDRNADDNPDNDTDPAELATYEANLVNYNGEVVRAATNISVADELLSESPDIPDPERPLNLSGLDASATDVCTDGVDDASQANDNLESDIAGFQADPPTVDRVTLATDKGIASARADICVDRANAFEDEILLAEARNADSNPDNDTPQAELDAYRANLTADRAEVTRAASDIAIADALLSEDQGVEPDDPFPGHVQLCPTDFDTGNAVRVKVEEVSVGVTPVQYITAACGEIIDLPLNRSLRFRLTAIVDDLDGDPSNDADDPNFQSALFALPVQLDDQSVALPSQSFTVFLQPDVAVGELVVPEKLMSRLGDGVTPLLDGGYVILQKQADGTFLAVTPSFCAHDVMNDVMSVESNCATFTPSNVTTGCELIEWDVNGAKAYTQVFNYDPNDFPPSGGPFTCPSPP